MKLVKKGVYFVRELRDLGLLIKIKWEKEKDLYIVKLYKNNKIIKFKIPASKFNLNSSKASIENTKTQMEEVYNFKYSFNIDLETLTF